MLNTPAGWEAMTEVECSARIDRMRRTTAALHDVFAAFTPWQHLSTGIAELDTLLGSAGLSCSSSSSGDGDASSNAPDKLRRRMRSGGFPVGGVHELYGPPLSGKSFLVRRIAATFVRRMTAFRQWCVDEMKRDVTWVSAAAFTALLGGEEVSGETDNRTEGSTAVDQPQTAAVWEWELHVCVVRGTSFVTSMKKENKQGEDSFFSAEVLSWQRDLMRVFPHVSSAGLRHAPAQQQQKMSVSQHQLQAEYAADHCHVTIVSTPNELLSFVEQLSQDSTPRTTSKISDELSTNDLVAAPAAVQQGPEANTSQTPPHHQSYGSHDADSDNVGAKRQRWSEKEEDTTSGPTSTSLLSSTPPSSSVRTSPAAAVRRWGLQRQRLLIIDGLEQLWLHPSFGTHGGTHTGQILAAELHRHLRRFVAPQLLKVVNARVDACSASEKECTSQPLTVYSTAVLTNGCQGGSYHLQTPQQLGSRFQTSNVSPQPLPRPLGNPVWWLAVDTRCLVEPAHPGLVSYPATTAVDADPDRANTDSELGSFGSWWTSHPLPSRPSPALCAAACISTSMRLPDVAVETCVTVVQGASCVCASWVQRRDEDDEECFVEEEGGDTVDA